MIETVIVILLSLTFGSFANNVISYFVNSNKFDLLHSTCFCGEKELKLIELIPILSYVMQKGNCKECQKRISLRYPLVEILTVIIGMLAYHLFGFEFRTLILFLILYILLMISVIDYSKLIIPNILSIVLLGLVAGLLLINSKPILTRLGLSFLVALSIIGLQRLFERFGHKDVLGVGDVKLIFVLSLLLNIADSMIAIWVSSLIGLITITILNIKRIKQLKEIKIPFGLYLSIGFTLVYLWNLKSDTNGLGSIITKLCQMK